MTWLARLLSPGFLAFDSLIIVPSTFSPTLAWDLGDKCSDFLVVALVLVRILMRTVS